MQKPTPPVKEIFSYDSGLLIVKQVSKNLDPITNYNDLGSFYLFTNLGGEAFYKPLKDTSAFYENARDDTIATPGMVFKIYGGGKIIDVYSPCCMKAINHTEVSRRKQLYVACPACRSPLAKAPLPTRSTLMARTTARVKYTFEQLAEAWGNAFTDTLNGIVLSADLLAVFEQVANESVSTLNAYENYDKALRKEQRAKEKIRFEQKIIAKFISELEANNPAESLLTPEVFSALKNASLTEKLLDKN